MKEVEIVFRAISSKKFYANRNRPLVQTVEFYFRKARNIQISIDLFSNGYVFYFLTLNDFEKFLDLVKIYFGFIKESSKFENQELNETDFNDWTVIIELNNSKLKNKEIFQSVKKIINNSIVFSYKIIRLSKKISKNPNIDSSALKLRTFDRKHLKKSMQDFFRVHKNTLFKIIKYEQKINHLV